MEGQRDSERTELGQIRWIHHRLNNGFIFRATYALVNRMPRGWSYAIGNVVTWLAWRLMSDGTAGLIENLKVARPGASAEELSRLALRTYRNYARDTIDFIRGLEQPRPDLESRVNVLDRAVFDRLLGEGRGVLLVTGHFGNFELGGVLLRRLLGYPLTVVVMAEVDPVVNEMRRRFRDSLGVETLEVRQSMDTALQIRRALAENRIVALLLDRHVGRDRVAVEFLGRRASFLRTPALLGYLTGAPLLPSFVVRGADGRFSGVSGEPIYVGRDGDRDELVQRATQAFATVLEQQVRERPDLWYQFYPYWPAAAEQAPEASA